MAKAGKTESSVPEEHQGAGSEDGSEVVSKSSTAREVASKLASGSVYDGSRKQMYRDFMILEDSNDDDDDNAMKCCDICPFKTDRTGLLELHKLRHRAPAMNSSSTTVAASYSCPHCPYFVRTSRQLERHMALHDTHGESNVEPLLNVQNAARCGASKNKYVCEKCPFVSLYRNEFWLHRRQHFVPRVEAPYSCEMCSFWASDRRTMSEHSVLHAQSYYPRLSVSIISQYRKPTNSNSCDQNLCETKVAEDVGDAVDPELGAHPHLEAVEQLVPSVSDPEVVECCPLLVPEYDQPLNPPEESGSCPTLYAEPLIVISTFHEEQPGKTETSDSSKVLPVDTNTDTIDSGLVAADSGPQSLDKTEFQSEEVAPIVEASTKQIAHTGSDDKTEPLMVDSEPGDDVLCRCSLQCPYCFFTVASVRLLRQHMVFHVAASDAALTPEFRPELDVVEDGRMDNTRCTHLLRFCDPCRQFASQDNTNSISGNSSSISPNLKSSDLAFSESENDKMSFLSKLFLCETGTSSQCENLELAECSRGTC